MKKNRGKILIFLATLLVISLSTIAIKKININNIECSSQFGECDSNLSESLDKYRGTNIFEVKRNISEKLANDISINSFSFQYKFPDLLRANVIKLTPTFGLKSSEGDLVALVDRSGKVLSLENFTNVPTALTESGLPQVGENVSDLQLFALEFLYDAISISEIKNSIIYENKLEIDYEDGIKVIAPLSGDREVLVGSLILIRSQLNSVTQDSKIGDDKQIREIDLRYKNPILR